MPRKRKTPPSGRAPYRYVSARTWELARADYLNGETAEVVAERFGIGVHNLRQTMSRRGWTKRALAEARATPGPGGPPVPPGAGADAAAGGTPPPSPSPSPPPSPASRDLMDDVLTRARAALAAGRGSEASALMKAAREYVILQQEVEDARHANEKGIRVWDEGQPARAGAISERVLLQTLHDRWKPLSDEDMLQRLDPERTTGLAELITKVQAAEAEEAAASRRGWR